MHQKKREPATFSVPAPAPPSSAIVRLIAIAESHELVQALDLEELMEPVSMSYASKLDRSDVRALVDRLAFA